MNYNEEDLVEGGGRAVPGVYAFTVGNAEDTVFKSGNPGITVVLQTAAFEDRDIKVTTRMVTTKAGLWKVKEFLDSIGVAFYPPPATESLIGKTGHAEYVLDEKGYLEAKKFLPADASNGPDGIPF